MNLNIKCPSTYAHRGVVIHLGMGRMPLDEIISRPAALDHWYMQSAQKAFTYKSDVLFESRLLVSGIVHDVDPQLRTAEASIQ